MTKGTRKLIKRIIHWILVAYIVVYIVTGFGITEFQTVEPLTFGLMGKAGAMRLHDNMEIPFIVLIGVHIFLILVLRDKNKD